MPVDPVEADQGGLRFTATMSGYLAEGVGDFEEGEIKGRKQGNTLSFDVKIEVESVSDFIKLSGQRAKISGTLFLMLCCRRQVAQLRRAAGVIEPYV